MQHGGHSDARAKVLGVGSDGDERLGRRLEQHAVDDGLVLPGDRSDWRGGNGANKSAIGDNRRAGPRLSPLARCQHRIPDIRRTSIFEVQPAEVELSFLNATQQFDPCDRDRCGPEQLEAEHRTDT